MLKKKFCRKGHVLTEENTKLVSRKNGRSEITCLTCKEAAIKRINSTDKARVRKRKWYQANKEHRKEYYIKNKERFRVQRKEYYLKTKPYLKQYGINVDEYNRLRVIQDARCRICGKHESELKTALVVDHCHDTGIIRALLCSACNVGIGNLQDDPQLCANAADYLNSFRDLGVDF